tara:strand:- start:393 stop:1400 length:1008 start_codon:yes stop_codon:yes gene_type:complete
MKNKLQIIAEAGVNHNGSLKIAKKLIDAAKKANVDFIKFQTYNVDSLIIKNTKKAKYQNKNDKTINQYDMLKKLQLSKKDFEILYNYTIKKGINFLSSPFDIESIFFLKKLGLKYIKIPSGEITNYPYLREIAKNKFNVIMSTGMSNFKEIKDCIKILNRFGTPNKNISVLYCVSSYPTLPEEINFNTLKKIKSTFKVNVGFSDHTLGSDIAPVSLFYGSNIIEKHFTLNKNMKGPDHRFSLQEDELIEFVKRLRKTENILINNNNVKAKKELINKDFVRKSIVANTDIKVGDKFTEKNLTTKRPGIGINPMKWNNVIGQKSKYNFKKNEIIRIK